MAGLRVGKWVTLKAAMTVDSSVGGMEKRTVVYSVDYLVFQSVVTKELQSVDKMVVMMADLKAVHWVDSSAQRKVVQSAVH